MVPGSTVSQVVVTVVDDVQGVLDVAVRGEHERLGGHTGCQRVRAPGWSASPARTAGPGRRPARTPRWPGRPARDRPATPLLADRVAVVPGLARVGAGLDRDGRTARDAHAVPAQVAHVPWIAKCSMSVVNPCAVRRLPTSSSASPSSASVTDAAGVADEVQVSACSAGCQVGEPAPEVGVPHEAELLEQLEGPVDGGDVHPVGHATGPG